MRQVPGAAVDLVAKWEGCKLEAYQDIVGVWTVGYGSTGPHVMPGLKITKAKARDLLKDDLGIAARRIGDRVKADVIADLTDNQYAALLSFVFNLGANPKWTIWKIINARSYDQVPAQLMRFVFAGGKKVRGLVNRRSDEAALWSLGEPGEVDENPPSSVTREIETPPAPMSKPLMTSKSFMTTGAAVIATAPVAVKQVSDAIMPFADRSEMVANMVATLATVAAALAIAALVFQWLKHRNGQK